MKDPNALPSQEEILAEAGVAVAGMAPGTQGNLASRIANDPLIQSIASRKAAEAFITEAIGELSPEQKERLINRAARDVRVPVPGKSVSSGPRVVWKIGRGKEMGQPFLLAEHDRGGGLVDNIYFTSKPEKLTKFRAVNGTWEPFKFRNEPVPQEYIEAYTQMWNSMTVELQYSGQMGSFYMNNVQPKQDLSLCPGPDYEENAELAKEKAAGKKLTGKIRLI